MENHLAEDTQKLIKAVLLLLIEARDTGKSMPPTELLLQTAGLGYQEIAELLGKKPDAVRMFLKRNRSKSI